jgi:hypothetical protein
MSGLEVADVVLGALPLVISALEHYVNCLNTAKRFWLYKKEMRSMAQLVKTEQSLFENTIEQLLTGIVKVERMAEIRSGANFWQDGAVEIGLKDRLRSSYEIYLDNVRGMEASLQKIMKKLALDPDGKVRPRPVLKIFVSPLLAATGLSRCRTGQHRTAEAFTADCSEICIKSRRLLRFLFTILCRTFSAT